MNQRSDFFDHGARLASLYAAFEGITSSRFSKTPHEFHLSLKFWPPIIGILRLLEPLANQVRVPFRRLAHLPAGQPDHLSPALIAEHKRLPACAPRDHSSVHPIADITRRPGVKRQVFDR